MGFGGIIAGAIGGAGTAMQEQADQRTKASLEMQNYQGKSDIDLSRAKALEEAKVAIANAPLQRMQGYIDNASQRQLPQEPAPVSNLSGAGVASFNANPPDTSGFAGDPGIVRSAILKLPDGPDKTKALAQLDGQVAADTRLNADAVTGKTRAPTTEEAIKMAADDAQRKDLPAFAAYETSIGRPRREERKLDVQEQKAENIASHYARMDENRSNAEQGKNDRLDRTLEAKGDAAHAPLTDEQEQVAQGIASGQLGPITGYGLRSPGAASIMARVLQINPKYQGQDYGNVGKADREFAIGKSSNITRSFNVAFAHLETLSGLSDALKNGDTQMFNRLGNAFAEQTGSPAPTNFNAAKQLVADEMVKAIIGAGGALQDREEAAKAVQAASSPDQLHGVIDTWKHMMVGQLDGLRRQYQASTGKDDFDSKYLSPEVRSMAAKFKPGASAGASAPRISSDAEFDALPSGATFIGPDGATRRKP